MPQKWAPEKSLLDWMAEVSPDLYPPHHLQPLPTLLQSAPHGNLRVCASPSVRHGKTTLALHAIAYWIKHDPTLSICYLTYGATFAQRNSRECRRLCVDVGVKFQKDHNTLAEQRTEDGGTIYWASTDQEIQGRGFDIVIVDDGLEWNERNNPEARDIADAAVNYLTTRLAVGGSVIIIGSRSHPDDLIGRRIGGRARAWTIVALPAIVDEGLPTERALWPEVRPLEHLKEVRAELIECGDDRMWESQYQGNPKASLDELFHDPMRYDFVPTWPGFRFVIGIDLAYTAGKDSDWFAYVVLKVYPTGTYVIDVQRMRADPAQLANVLGGLMTDYGGPAIFSYVSGPEWGTIHLLADRGIHIQGINARYNKRVRAQKTIDKMNAGKILYPQRGPWVDAHIKRLKNFTGLESARDDDEIDALVSAIDGGGGSSMVAPRAFGSPRM